MDQQILDVASKVNIEIQKQNNLGNTVALIVTGNNSSGKTTITKELLKLIDVYQAINLGVASKYIRYFRQDIKPDILENFADPSAERVFKHFIEFNLDHYWSTGVNIILEGVQIDTVYFTPNEKVTAGVVLEIPTQVALRRGYHPETHFKRSITEANLRHRDYPETLKFKRIANSADINTTVLHTLTFIYQRLLWLNATSNQ